MKGFQLLTQRIKKQGKKIYLIPIISGIFLFALIFVQNSVDKRIEGSRIESVPPSLLIKEAPYPMIDSKIQTPLVSAKSAVIINTDSGIVLFSKNKDAIFPMASTTKLMTAIVALDYYKPDNIITIGKSRIGGVVAGFRNGEKFYFKDVLYAMMLPSFNDAALAVAQNYPGGNTAFVEKMNEKAKEYNLSNTSFFDPSGLNENNYTTASDLARLAGIAMKNKILAKVVGTEEKEISDIAQIRKYQLKNLNKLLGRDGINGVKTGFTNEAGEVLVTSREENGHMVIIVVLNSKERFIDTEQLVGYIKGNISYLNLGL